MQHVSSIPGIAETLSAIRTRAEIEAVLLFLSNFRTSFIYETTSANSNGLDGSALVMLIHGNISQSLGTRVSFTVHYGQRSRVPSPLRLRLCRLSSKDNEGESTTPPTSRGGGVNDTLALDFAFRQTSTTDPPPSVFLTRTSRRHQRS